MDSKPLVSICTTTYNREKYIGQAIESCMSQITTFPFDMVICDNCSEDKTVEIIEEYIQKYPDKIKLLKADRNYGLMVNYQKSLESGTGKYIADCDGDDYWIDPYKLQKQVDFLEANPDFVLCFTNTLIKNDETGEEKIAKINVWDICDASQLIEHNGIEGPKYGEEINSPGHVSAMVFRNHVINKFPDWYKGLYINDMPLFLMLSKHGKSKFINDVSTVYRINPLGISTEGFTSKKDCEGSIDFFKKINKYHDYKLNNQIKHIISVYYLKLVKIYYRQKEYYNAARCLFLANYYNINQFKKVFKKIFS